MAKKPAKAKTPKNAPAAPKKTAAKKPAVKKPAAKKASPKRAKPKAGSTSTGLFLSKEAYKATIDGLRAQGLDQEDAIDTLRVGLREANGRPVPTQLRGLASNEPRMQLAA